MHATSHVVHMVPLPSPCYLGGATLIFDVELMDLDNGEDEYEDVEDEL